MRKIMFLLLSSYGKNRTVLKYKTLNCIRRQNKITFYTINTILFLSSPHGTSNTITKKVFTKVREFTKHIQANI